MIQRVRLQRKFNLKVKVDPIQRLGLISRTMVVFWLALLLIYCLLNFSLHFHISHVFTSDLCLSEHDVNSNLALAISLLLEIPYIVFIETTSASLSRDLIATTTVLHTLSVLIVQNRIGFTFLLFIVVLTGVTSFLGRYGAIFREQKKLIDEIRTIENADRLQSRVREQEFQSLKIGDRMISL